MLSSDMQRGLDQGNSKENGEVSILSHHIINLPALFVCFSLPHLWFLRHHILIIFFPASLAPSSESPWLVFPFLHLHWSALGLSPWFFSLLDLPSLTY